MSISYTIAPCLWFNDQAEAAAAFYTSIFPNGRIVQITRYGEVGHEIHGKSAGTVLTVEFELHGQPFTALNGGPAFTFNEAVSLQVLCDTQNEIDHYWEKLGAGGDEAAQQCGWLKDQYGVSWQVVPRMLSALLKKGDANKSERVMAALLHMKKLDIAELERAAAAAPAV